MGDRNNIFFREDNDGNGVYLYTHWNGSSMGDDLQEGLARAYGRLDDPPYATRVIIQSVLYNHETDHRTLTGWGISATLGDGSGRIWVVDFPSQRVCLVTEGQERTLNSCLRSWDFDKFDGGR